MEPGTDLAQQVQKALVAHGAWKVRLAQAIDSGTSEFSPDVVHKDNQCALGKWLYFEVGPARKGGDHYDTVRRLHAEFHVAAANVLALALLGHAGEARAAMLMGQDFGKTSTRLTIALDAWRAAVAG